jgi:hypothetical protein
VRDPECRTRRPDLHGERRPRSFTTSRMRASGVTPFEGRPERYRAPCQHGYAGYWAASAIRERRPVIRRGQPRTRLMEPTACFRSLHNARVTRSADGTTRDDPNQHRSGSAAATGHSTSCHAGTRAGGRCDRRVPAGLAGPIRRDWSALENRYRLRLSARDRLAAVRRVHEDVTRRRRLTRMKWRVQK